MEVGSNFFCCQFVSFTDQYHCPVTFKVFNNNSHIVAVKTTGNVFSYDVSQKSSAFSLVPDQYWMNQWMNKQTNERLNKYYKKLNMRQKWQILDFLGCVRCKLKIIFFLILLLKETFSSVLLVPSLLGGKGVC